MAKARSQNMLYNAFYEDSDSQVKVDGANLADDKVLTAEEFDKNRDLLGVDTEDPAQQYGYKDTLLGEERDRLEMIEQDV
eukprot:CAMPEP_0116877414 /NCGR_PEP_ID=MMETSP0463-20121206/9198_1 /TAXON_ID=181622 /ORGANISM="Strombidinopsis sp, Strain SopsisLIS2011" /LENGTH=79 /DNA_ID=CAMNT_0004524679 /DNA_START=1921 /DNA_END=2160 /DNA_ORIENTATION=+